MGFIVFLIQEKYSNIWYFFDMCKVDYVGILGFLFFVYDFGSIYLVSNKNKGFQICDFEFVS